MPSSQNIVVMIQLLDKPAAAARMAKTLLTIYAASAVPLAFLFKSYLKYTGL